MLHFFIFSLSPCPYFFFISFSPLALTLSFSLPFLLSIYYISLDFFPIFLFLFPVIQIFLLSLSLSLSLYIYIYIYLSASFIYYLKQDNEFNRESGDYNEAPLLNSILDNSRLEEEVFADVIGFVVGGFHTTGNFLTWLMYNLVNVILVFGSLLFNLSIFLLIWTTVVVVILGSVEPTA